MSASCDHKFVDSKSCLKCGWTPPANHAEQLALIATIRAEIDAKAPLLAEWEAAVPDELLSQAEIDSARASLKSRLAALQLQLDHAVARGVQ